MSNDRAWLALWLDAPLQSWGFESRFERRHSGMFPTKSGILGMICAAMGAPKGSPREREILAAFAEPGMIAVSVPRRVRGRELPVRRLTDYHTVLDTRTADSPKPRSNHTVQSWRDYLVDAKFIVLLPGVAATVREAASALRDPVWGTWLGRKSCIPALPVLVTGGEAGAKATFKDAVAAWEAALAFGSQVDEADSVATGSPLESFAHVKDAGSFTDCTDTWNDAPEGFGRMESSGVEGRQFAPRRVQVVSRSNLPKP